MCEQIEMKEEDSNIISLGFCKCEDCEDEPICPHAHIREGCRTKISIDSVIITPTSYPAAGSAACLCYLVFVIFPVLQSLYQIQRRNIMDISVKVNIALCVLSFILAAVSVVTVIITLRQNSRMIEASTRPYISMYLGTTYFASTTAYLIMKNYGTTAATITGFSCDTDLAIYSYSSDHIPFTNIIGYSLCPGESLRFPIQVTGISRDVVPIGIHIAYKSPSKSYSEDLSVSLSAHFDMLHLRTHTTNQELKTISYTLQDIAEKML